MRIRLTELFYSFTTTRLTEGLTILKHHRLNKRWAEFAAPLEASFRRAGAPLSLPASAALGHKLAVLADSGTVVPGTIISAILFPDQWRDGNPSFATIVAWQGDVDRALTCYVEDVVPGVMEYWPLGRKAWFESEDAVFRSELKLLPNGDDLVEQFDAGGCLEGLRDDFRTKGEMLERTLAIDVADFSGDVDESTLVPDFHAAATLAFLDRFSLGQVRKAGNEAPLVTLVRNGQPSAEGKADLETMSATAVYTNAFSVGDFQPVSGRQGASNIKPNSKEVEENYGQSAHSAS